MLCSDGQKQQSKSLWATALNKAAAAWNPHAEKRNKALISCPNPYTEAEPCPIICRQNAKKKTCSPDSNIYNVNWNCKRSESQDKWNYRDLVFHLIPLERNFGRKKYDFFESFLWFTKFWAPEFAPSYVSIRRRKMRKKILFLKLTVALRCWLKKIGRWRNGFQYYLQLWVQEKWHSRGLDFTSFSFHQ